MKIKIDYKEPTDAEVADWLEKLEWFKTKKAKLASLKHFLQHYINRTDVVVDLDIEQIESLLAEAIDDLYLRMKGNFVDYKNQTHKLGWYKENVKKLFHEKLKRYQSGLKFLFKSY